MSSGKTVTRSKVKKQPVMIHLDPFENARLTDYAREERMSKSKVVREAIELRMRSKIDPYISGFNDGLNAAIEATQSSKGGAMMFPSGKSFSQLVVDDIEKLRKRGKEAL
jgi:hypothetical protein